MTRRVSQSPGSLESRFDASFATQVALREKQIQQTYRPIIGIHKWFARRPGTMFRSLLLSEYVNQDLSQSFWKPHRLRGVIADPFMGGGTPIYEANRLGFDVVGCDINPMAHWIVKQSLEPLDLDAFRAAAESTAATVEARIGSLYKTKCTNCARAADVKYFLWVKTAACPHCSKVNSLFPGYRLAEAKRHPREVLVCGSCGSLNEYERLPTRRRPQECHHCGESVHVEGNVARRKVECTGCGESFKLGTLDRPPEHRMWAIEYHCEDCYRGIPGRQFKQPDSGDLETLERATDLFSQLGDSLRIPTDAIPPGDETDRLLRWGYRYYRDMFGTRQLLGLGMLLEAIEAEKRAPIRRALLTVFSDTLRYQNLLCRYDTYALKCQDIFSVHGFPVGLVQCENNLLGIPGIGSGAFRHFVRKYLKAKQYCLSPFETRHSSKKKEIVYVEDETIAANVVTGFPKRNGSKQALLINAPSQDACLPANSLDGVFTDPPYYDNVQYAELIDFCFAWLRQSASFSSETTRSAAELTGNATMGRGLAHFTEGLAAVFLRFTQALKPGAPFVFTYHHNDPAAYVPIVVAILDAGLNCTATLPAAAEMSASMHIVGTGSSILDSVFVCRRMPRAGSSKGLKQASMALGAPEECLEALRADAVAMISAGVKISHGDLRCLVAGHVARLAVQGLHPIWCSSDMLSHKMDLVQSRIQDLAAEVRSLESAPEFKALVSRAKKREATA
ncbi:MAG: DNA methylase [Polyangiaceae bacterium]